MLTGHLLSHPSPSSSLPWFLVGAFHRAGCGQCELRRMSRGCLHLLCHSVLWPNGLLTHEWKKPVERSFRVANCSPTTTTDSRRLVELETPWRGEAPARNCRSYVRQQRWWDHRRTRLLAIVEAAAWGSRLMTTSGPIQPT